MTKILIYNALGVAFVFVDDTCAKYLAAPLFPSADSAQPNLIYPCIAYVNSTVSPNISIDNYLAAF